MIEKGITESLRKNRYTVVAVDSEKARVRVRGEDGETCSDLSCREGVVVVTEDEARVGLGRLNPGDVIRVNEVEGHPAEIVVLRRAWEELTSPEV